MAKTRTICSAPTKQELEKLINEYFCSTNCVIMDDNTTVLNVKNGIRWDKNEGFSIKQRKGRWMWVREVF